MKLNLGSRNSVIDGFDNVDLLPCPTVKYVCNVNKLAFAKDNEVDEIYASNVLEHFTYSKIRDVLREWNRVLKPRGKIYVSVPDMINICELVCKYGWELFIERMVYGEDNYEYGPHGSGFDFDKLKTELEATGFTDVTKVVQFPIHGADETRERKYDASMLGFDDPLGTFIPVSLNVIAYKEAK